MLLFGWLTFFTWMDCNGLLGCGESHWESKFCHFKVFRLHAILHDATGTVGSISGKRPGDCYIPGRVTTSSLFRHVIELLFCLSVKLFLRSFFSLVNVWSRMSHIVPDVQLRDKKAARELEALIDGNVQGYFFSPPEKYKLTKQAFWCTRNLHEIF